MGNNRNKTKAKTTLILSGVCNTIATLIHLAITILLIVVAVMCWNGNEEIGNAIGDAIESDVIEILLPIILRVIFVVLIRIAIHAFVLFAMNLATAIDCYLNSNKEPQTAIECKGGLTCCGVFELIGAIVLAAIGVMCKLMPSFLDGLQDVEDVLNYAFIAFVVIAVLLLVCCIIKFIASGILGKEKRMINC